MSKNKKVMSIAIKPDLEVEITKSARRKGVSKSELIGNVMEQVVKLNPDDDPVVIGKSVDEDVTQIMLKIPNSLKNFPEKLKQWMDVQSNGIIAKMTEKSNSISQNESPQE